MQKLYKTIKEINSNILIIYYQPEEEEEDIIERNKVGVSVMAKNIVINFSEAMPNYLWQIQKYFPNRRPNRKCIFSKFCFIYNVDIGDIILTLREALEKNKFYMKL